MLGATIHITQIREFLAVAQAGSITAAAENIYVSQPVLSKHMRAIEDELNGRLLMRTPRGIQLTPLGVRARDSFESILMSYDELIEAASRERTMVRGALHLGMLSSGFNRYIASTVFDLKREYPSIEVQSSIEKPSEIRNDLVRGKLDVGFSVLSGEQPPNTDELEHLIIAHEPMLIAIPASSPVAVKEALSPLDLSPIPLICLNNQDTTAAMNKQLFAAGIRPQRIIEIDGVEFAPYFIEQTKGFFAIAEFMLEQFEAYPNIKVLPMNRPLWLCISFVYLRSNENPALQAFLDVARKRIEYE